MRTVAVLCLILIAASLRPISTAAAGDADAGPPRSTILIAGMIGDRHAYGCGVIVSARSSSVAVLTAAHNLEMRAARYLTVTGEELTFRAVRAIDDHDLAIVTVSRPKRPFEPATFTLTPPIGARLHLWGPVHDTPFTAQTATVRAIDRRAGTVPEAGFAIDCSLCDHGDSGAGVFDENENLVGVVTSGYYAAATKVFVLVEGYQPATEVAQSP